MLPDQRELDDEIRGHLAISVQERIDRGESPEAARRNALMELGYIPDVRDSMRRVWFGRWVDAGLALAEDLRIGVRSLRRAKGLAATVVITLALGIGANAAIFSVVRGVLLRPLVNRDEDRLIYIQQSAPGLGAANEAFSVPEIDDFKSRVKSVNTFGDFSTINFTLVGLGEPREVKAGVVSGSYFDVMGLQPVRGRLLNKGDDGPNAPSVAVLTYRFWRDSLNSDPLVVGRSITLGGTKSMVVGVLEPSLPYPVETQVIANVVTSPHHLSATMVTERTHRMTELFGRLEPGVRFEDARTELSDVYRAMKREHPKSYPEGAGMSLSVNRLRDQITSPARSVLLILMATSAVVFVIACFNVANLMLARSVKREREMQVRAALGAGRMQLRRALLAESLLLGGAGATLGVLLAPPLVLLVARFASRFSVRALDVTVDATVLLIGALLAVVAAAALAFLPVSNSGFVFRRLRVFATTQIAFTFVLLAAAAALVATLIGRQRTDTGYDVQHVIAFNVPTPGLAVRNDAEMDAYESMTRRVEQISGVQRAALGGFVPWRDATSILAAGAHLAGDGFTPGAGQEPPIARLRFASPGWFDVVGVPIVAGRDFSGDDGRNSEQVVIVSQSVARRLFPDGKAIDGHVWWVDPYFGAPSPRRIVGIAADVDDESVTPNRTMAVYHPARQMRIAGRLVVRTSGDPYALVGPVTQMIHELLPNQPVEHAQTLADIRADVLAPERVNAFVVAGFATIALIIAVVGIGGVLAFSVSARTREFGVLLAMGSTPGGLLWRVLKEGAAIAGIGIGVGAPVAFLLIGLGAGTFGLSLPGPVPLTGAALTLAASAILASLLPAARAARVDVIRALRIE